MKISYNWLKRYLDLTLDPAGLAEKLTRAGLEVEGIETRGAIPDGVVTAKILSRKKHENSDHLSICEVDNGTEVLQIVCGAPNCDAGNLVPLAMIGTTFADKDGSFTIRKGKIRGVESFGMMCSARELGLGDDHGGLLILAPDTPLGVPFQSLCETDTGYDCSVTPNRPDWLSHYGVARDVAALCSLDLKQDPIPTFDEVPDSGIVTVERPDLCPCYVARVVRGIRVAESPAWLKNALNSVGIRPINNIVDITNYVLMAYGEPLHAFDLRNLAGGRIVVRTARTGESLVALDGKTYELNPENLCICDAEKPVAVAGVMGGEYSGVQADTDTIVLESAWFDPASVRATSRKLGLFSDSSHRFERGVDRNAVLPAGLFALQLILELAGGTYTETSAAVLPVPPARTVAMNFDRVRSLLGMTVSEDEMDRILQSLGFLRCSRDADGAVYEVPSWRDLDISGEADLAEEIARIHGLDQLPEVPILALKADYRMDACHIFETLRSQLSGIGLDEIMSGSMMDEKAATADGCFTAEDLIRMNHPISLDLSVMRPALLPCVLACVRHNIARKNTDLALFELGHVFCANPEKFPEERDELVLALTGRVHPERFSSERAALYDFYDLKGAVESLLEARRVESYAFEPDQDRRFVKGACARLMIDGVRVGVLGELIPPLTKGMRLGTPLFVAVLQVAGLLSAKEKSILYVPISPFPPTARDVAFLADSSLEHRAVLDFIRAARVPNLERVELFDVFEDEATLGKGKKSMAYSLVFRSGERTLTDDEVNSAHETLRAKLEPGLGVKLR